MEAQNIFEQDFACYMFYFADPVKGVIDWLVNYDNTTEHQFYIKCKIPVDKSQPIRFE